MRATFSILFFSMACILPLQAQRQQRSAPVNIPETNPHTSEADVEAGRKLYLGRCGHCHGQSGEGGRGATLNSGRLRRGNSDRELFAVVRFGIPNTEMPGSFLPDHEIWRMVGYVKRLSGQQAPETATGSASAGALVYEKNGCAACHSIGGKGGFLGPDLSDVGAKRALRHLRESTVDPEADIPLDYRTVTVTTAAGKSTTGIHLNEDEYSVHLRDMSGGLRSFLKSELQEVKLPRKSVMPAYSTLSQKELEDLVAYLSSLR